MVVSLALVALVLAVAYTRPRLRLPAVMGAMVAFSAVPAFAQAEDLATGAKSAATTAVAGGAAVALVILAAVILYRIIKRFSS